MEQPEGFTALGHHHKLESYSSFKWLEASSESMAWEIKESDAF